MSKHANHFLNMSWLTSGMPIRQDTMLVEILFFASFIIISCHLQLIGHPVPDPDANMSMLPETEGPGKILSPIAHQENGFEELVRLTETESPISSVCLLIYFLSVVLSSPFNL